MDREYPGSHIGPEPTTDKFTAVMNGASEKVIPGNAACVSSELPFTGLTRFGTSFMSKFNVAQVPAGFLEKYVTLFQMM